MIDWENNEHIWENMIYNFSYFQDIPGVHKIRSGVHRIHSMDQLNQVNITKFFYINDKNNIKTWHFSRGHRTSFDYYLLNILWPRRRVSNLKLYSIFLLNKVGAFNFSLTPFSTNFNLIWWETIKIRKFLKTVFHKFFGF